MGSLKGADGRLMKNTTKLITILMALSLSSCISIGPNSSSSSKSETQTDTSSSETASESEDTSETSSESSSSESEETSESEESSESSESSSETEESSESSEPPVESSESSSESSSEDVPEGEYATISFDFSSLGNGRAVESFDGYYEAEGVAVSEISASKAYSSTDGSIRLGNSSANGSIILNFAEYINVKSITILGKSYGSDGDVSISLSFGGKNKNLTVKSALDSYKLQADEGGVETKSLKISTTAVRKRVYIQEIRIELGELSPVYPSSITLSPSSKKVGVGASYSLSVSYAPENTNQKNVRFESEEPSVANVDENGLVTALAIGKTVLRAIAKTETGTVEAVSNIEVVDPSETIIEQVDILQKYTDYTENNVYPLDSCPTIGTIHPVVIPVWFTDSSTYISNKDAVREDINAAYFGPEEETGWHSVKTFYEEESKGLLTVDGITTSWYNANKKSTDFYSEDSGMDATLNLVESATSWFFQNYKDHPRSYYDSDSDGYLDAVLLIYAAPDYVRLNNDNASNLWAYCYWMQDPSLKNVSNPGPNTFFWASYDFIYGSNAKSRTGKSTYNGGDTSHCDVDAHTFIHEMGHVFGLEDYYDYGPNYYSPAAGFSMQDHNVGGHDPYSVMAYGWADPYIPTESCEITIKPFQENHDMIILTPEWNEFDSPFDEYLILELFTPTGLNELDCTYAYDNAYSAGPSATGIRLWHVDARLAYSNSAESVTYQGQQYQEPVFKPSQLTSDVNFDCLYGVTHAFSNTSGDDNYGSVLGSDYDKYNLLQVIHNSKTATYKSSADLSNSSLFRNGATFSIGDFSKQFGNGTKLNSSKDLGWSFSVAIKGSGASAEATITLVKE